MEENPYQPPLLNLQDMLNLSDTDDPDIKDDWANNPYNIHNFFEPITSPVRGPPPHPQQSPSTSTRQQGSGGRTTPMAKPGPSSAGSTSSQGHYINPFATPPKKRQHSPLKTPQQSGSGSKKTPKGTAKLKPEEVDEDELLHGFGVDMFEEMVVTAELQNSKEETEYVEFLLKPESESVDFQQDSSGSGYAGRLSAMGMGESPMFLPDSDCEQEDRGPKTSAEVSGPGMEEGGGAKLEEVLVDIDDASLKEQLVITENDKKRTQAIFQLDSLIGILKQYSKLLEGFLLTEGDLILEHYNAQTMLSGIIPEMAPDAEHPFEAAQSIKQVLVDHVKGRTVLSTLPPRRAHVWRTSELILLQKAVLESAISRKEFLLNCRYTDLLTEMGFDADDLQRLEKNPTVEMELGTLKIIMNEHEFLSKSKVGKKQAIRTVIIRNSAAEGHRALVLPPPEQLVQDKWKGLAEIRRRTVLSKLKDEDIDWLFVMKKLWMKNPKLKVDETTCKLTYDHFISFKYNRSPWHIDELKSLQRIREKFPSCSWAQVAKRLRTNRTPFSCFNKYKAHCVNNSVKLEVPRTTLRFITSCYEDFRGNVTRLDYQLTKTLPRIYKSMKPKNLLTLFRSTFNPRLKKGSFTIVEDALLFVTMEKYKKYLLEGNGMMDPIAFALPWRMSTMWKMRYSRLLTNFYHKSWTIEDDKLLLNLVDEHGPKYKVIQRFFPHKDRKQCRSRHMQLVDALKMTNLEKYHMIYGYRFGGLHVRKLEGIAEHLNFVIKLKIAGNARWVRETDLQFFKFRRAPKETELDSYLMTFPVQVLVSAFDRLTDCLLQITEKWKEMGSTAGLMFHADFSDPTTSFNRRIFDPNCSASVASALHLRNAKLVTRETLENLSPFEENVYNYHAYFSLRGKPKTSVSRSNIPTLDTLRKFTNISRLIAKSVVAQGSGYPAVIMQVKSNTSEDKAKEEANAFEELQNKKLGGRRKGCKKRKTQMREARQKAAMTRWNREKLLSYDENSVSGGGSPWSTGGEFNSPTTPSSVASFSSAEGGELEADSGSGSTLRRTIDGVISDHSYILPMYSPNEYHSVPLPQLFSMLGQQKQQQRHRDESIPAVLRKVKQEKR